MSTVKISELPISTINSSTNTSNIYFVVVDSASKITSKASETQLSQSIFSNNILNVGVNPNLFPGTIAQLSGNNSTYLQTNMQNFNSTGSIDLVGTCDIGGNSNNYIDLGINNSAFNNSGYTSMNPLDGYLYVQGSSPNSNTGSLVLGTSSSAANIVFIAGGTNSANIVAKFNASELDLFQPTTITSNTTISTLTISQYGTGPAFLVNDVINDTTPFIIDANGSVGIGTTSTSNYKLNVGGDIKFSGNIVFSDSSIQTTASSPASITISAYNQANTAISNIISANTWLQANDGITLAAAKVYTDNANTYIQTNYLANTSNVLLAGNLNISGNIVPSSANTYNLGSPTNRWASLYLSGNTISMLDSTTNISVALGIAGGILQINGSGAGIGNTSIYANGSIVSANVQVSNILTSNTTVCNTLQYTTQVLSPNYITVVSGTSVQLSNTNSNNILLSTPSSPNTPIIMPANPINGQMCTFTNAGTSTGMYTCTTSTMIPPPLGITVGPGKGFKYFYNSSNSTWYAGV